jgi:F0F1-type ATP synthase delta subunit
LSKDIVSLLYSKDEAKVILRTYSLAGIFSITDKESFKLHEEIQDLLRAYARSKGYLKSDETKEYYQKLKEYIVQKHQNSEDESWMFDATYYAILADSNLVKKGYDAEEFFKALIGTVLLSSQEKWKIANEELPNLKNGEIKNIINYSANELEILKKVIGKDVAKELKKDFEDNILIDFYNIDYWESKVKKVGKSGHYMGLLYTMDELEIYDDYISIVDEMLNRYQNSSNEMIQKRCAKALYNKRNRLGQLGKSEEEIEVYDTLLSKYQDSTNETIQEQCANALFNKGVRLGQLGKIEEEIEV